MTSVPMPFRARIASHNRSAVVMACLSFAGAVILWFGLVSSIVVVLLTATTAARGDFGPRIPEWIFYVALGAAASLFVWGAADRCFRRFRPLDDRPILGWHVIPEVLLLPVRLTYGIWENLGAIQRLDERELAAAWNLLAEIHAVHRARLSSLALIEPESRRLKRLLDALRLAGLVEMRRGEQDWLFMVPPREAETLRRMLDAPDRPL